MMDRIKIVISVRSGEPFAMFVTRESFRALLSELQDLEPKWLSVEGESVIVHLFSDDIVAITQEIAVVPAMAN